MDGEEEGRRSCCSLLGSLARVPQEPRHWYDVIAWWELRRIAYNLIVGIEGMAGVALYLFIDTLPPRLPPDQLDWDVAFSIFGGAIVANILYTCGWVCEIGIRLLIRQQIRWFGPVMFSLGLLLSLAAPVSLVALNAFFWLSRVLAPS